MQAILVVGAAVLIVLIQLIFMASRFKRVGPHQALVVSGVKRMVVNPTTGERKVLGSRVVTSGGTFVLPLIERVDVLSLEVITVPVRAEVRGREGERVEVNSVAQVKVAGGRVHGCRITFLREVSSPDEAREVLVEMVGEARAAAQGP